MIENILRCKFGEVDKFNLSLLEKYPDFGYIRCQRWTKASDDQAVVRGEDFCSRGEKCEKSSMSYHKDMSEIKSCRAWHALPDYVKEYILDLDLNDNINGAIMSQLRKYTREQILAMGVMDYDGDTENFSFQVDHQGSPVSVMIIYEP